MKRKGQRQTQQIALYGNLWISRLSLHKSSGIFGLVDIVGICSIHIVLEKVKTRDWRGPVEMEAIRLFWFGLIVANLPIDSDGVRGRRICVRMDIYLGLPCLCPKGKKELAR